MSHQQATRTTAAIEFRLLGDPEIRIDGRTVPLGSAKVRLLATSLMARMGSVASVQSIVADLWHGDPPTSAVANVRTYAATLRRAVPDERLVTVNGGYRLVMGPEEFDVTRSRRLVREARRSMERGEVGRAHLLLDQARQLWQGRPCGPLVAGPALTATQTALEDERHALIELFARSGMACGADAQVLPRLRIYAAEYPLLERVQELLILGLWRRGDIAAALGAYARARTALVSELGIEPGPGLSGLHAAILRGDPPVSALGSHVESELASGGAFGGVSGTRTTPGVAISFRQARRRSPRPHELPLAPDPLVGRERELRSIESALAGVTDAGEAGAAVRRAPTVVAVHGAVGVGTSALVLTAAHRIAPRFPDGQVYVDLAHAVQVDSRSVILRVLRSLRGLDDGLPEVETPEEGAARFRTALYGRRVLVVLDNVTDAAQVAGLVPAGQEAALLVASGPMLATVSAGLQVGLGPLAPEDAIALLARASGRTLPAGELGPAADVVAWCDRLPLAVCIAGARLRSRPDLPVSVLARRLADETNRLDELAYGSAAVRARLQLAYRALSGGVEDGLMGRLYRSLGRLGGQVVSPDDVAGLAGLAGEASLARVVSALDRMVDVGVLAPGVHGTYRLPDLVRLHAREQTAA